MNVSPRRLWSYWVHDENLLTMTIWQVVPDPGAWTVKDNIPGDIYIKLLYTSSNSEAGIRVGSTRRYLSTWIKERMGVYGSWKHLTKDEVALYILGDIP